MDTEVLDLIADDGAGVQKQKATYHWDRARNQPEPNILLLIPKWRALIATSLHTNVRKMFGAAYYVFSILNPVFSILQKNKKFIKLGKGETVSASGKVWHIV